MSTSITLPELGEGIESGVIAKLVVKLGDRIDAGAPLVELETGKAIVPVPSPASGVVKAIHVKEGEEIKVGQKLIDLDGEQKEPPILAGPATRKLARERGVDLHTIKGTENSGRISKADVEALEREEPLSQLRKMVAKSMSQSAAEIPHVFQFHHVDVTTVTEKIKEWKSVASPVTMTAVLIKVLGTILAEMPKFNASLDMNTAKVRYHASIHLGVAVDTEAGLIVPVLRDANHKSLVDIAVRLKQLAEKARARTLTPAELKGATFTLSNLGGIGGGLFTPLINPPEVALLGVARSVITPIYEQGAWVPKTMLPIVLAYDHRLIDGADAARFVVRLAELLNVPVIEQREAV